MAEVKKRFLLLAVPVLTLPFLPAAPRRNPPAVPSRAVEAHLDVPTVVSSVLRRACGDCHSNETRWPAYSRIAPFSWMIARDVNGGRRAMNLSEWSTGSGRNPAVAIATLAAVCADVRDGRMPLPKYLLLHPGARLSAADKAAVCDWTSVEIARLAARPGIVTARR